jgi:hypothetical protein
MIPPLSLTAQSTTAGPDAASQPFLECPAGIESDPKPQGESFKPVSLTIFFENDGTFVRPNYNSDRHYTSGQGFHIAGPFDPIIETELIRRPYSRDAIGFVFVQQIYAPENVTDPNPPRDDRPYAGFLYGGFFYQRQNYNLNGIDTLDHVQLDLGVIGPSSLAEQAQSEVHRLTGDADPQGWDTQLGDELQVQLNLRRQWRIDLLGQSFDDSQLDPEGAWLTDFGVQLIPEVSVDVGTALRRTNAGAYFRLGTNLPDDFGPTRMTAPGSAAGLPVRGLSTYLFAGAVGRYVEWDTLLDGSYARDPSRSVEREPWQAEGTVGAAIEFSNAAWNFKLTYSQTWLTHAFKKQALNDGYGSIGVTAAYRF